MPTDHEGASGTNKMRANRKVLESKCTSCGEPFNFGGEVYFCQICHGYHHALCWESGRGCTGSLSTPAIQESADSPTLSPTPPPVDAGIIETETSPVVPKPGIDPDKSAILQRKSDNELRQMLEQPEKYPSDTISAVRFVLEEREQGRGRGSGAAMPALAQDEQYCTNCGNVIKSEALKCRFCGHTLHALAAQEIPSSIVQEITKTTNSALTNAIVSIFICAPILGPQAISKANNALKLMDKYPAYDGPRGKAQAARIIAWIAIALFVIAIISRVSSNMPR